MEAIAWIHKRVDVRAVIVPPGRRPLDEAYVQRLVESIRLIGLINPIRVSNHIPGSPAILVAGAHRLEAVRRLGWDSIPAHCNVKEDQLDTALAYIDENLIRRNLSPAEEALAIVKRAKLLEQIEARDREAAEVSAQLSNNLRQPKKNGGKSMGVGRGKGGGRKAKAASDEAVAKLMGASRQTVQRRRKAIEKVGEETAAQVIGTSLDKPREMEALAKLPEPERKAKVAEAMAEAAKPKEERKAVSARLQAPPSIPATPGRKYFRRIASAPPVGTADIRRALYQYNSRGVRGTHGLTALERAWNDASKGGQQEFLRRRVRELDRAAAKTERRREAANDKARGGVQP